MSRWSNDLVLRALEEIPSPIGTLISAFPGRAAAAEHPAWIDDWFRTLIGDCNSGNPPKLPKLFTSSAEPGVLSPIARPPVDRTVRLVAIQPNYFRGYREAVPEINFDADLIVVEGRNSTGKTSLSEAIEWLLTGILSRRHTGRYGSARELADCITNEFCPAGGTVWVKGVFATEDRHVHLRRVLVQDYTAATQSAPISKLYHGDRELTAQEEQALLDDLFAGVHPIMMQHTLREFIHNTPEQRRQYFERSLQVDELTALIEKAVIGDARLRDFPCPTGTGALQKLTSFKTTLGDTKARRSLELTDRTPTANVPERLRAGLVVAAQAEFPEIVAAAATFEDCRNTILDAQRVAREREYPILARLRRTPNLPPPNFESLQDSAAAFSAAVETFTAAKRAAANIADAERAVARALDLLGEHGLVAIDEPSDQVCPICNDPSATLNPARIAQVRSWLPLTQSHQRAKDKLDRGRVRLTNDLETLKSAAAPTAIDLPEQPKFLKAISNAPSTLQADFTTVYDQAEALSRTFRELHSLAIDLGTIAADFGAGKAASAEFDDAVRSLMNARGAIQDQTARHLDVLAHLEAAIGASARADEEYRKRELWLEIASSLSAVIAEVEWERAALHAQKLLTDIRKAFIETRGEIIEDARRTFTDRLSQVWQQLRSDIGARFSRISIPSARGRGFKLEIEVKASIGDAAGEVEVDALRVFSESQINVIGIAAYVTRARLLGHTLMIFDDPVQSMDEEHYGSFASTLLNSLLDDGHQILVFTHSETFARLIADKHFERTAYVTLQTRYSKRKGCWVEEGNRRVAERLKVAQRLAENGELELAWRNIRLALERLYTLAKTKADGGFDPASWRNATAEDMWMQGAGQAIENEIADAGPRLKQVLRMTAYGAHDKAAPSVTDIVSSIDYLRGLLGPLRLGDG